MKYKRMRNESEKKKVVVLGAGFGGLAAARTLGQHILMEERLKRSYEIILIDQHAYQLYTPTLYEIATTSQGIAKNIELEKIVTFPVEKAISGLPIIFRQGSVKSIDLKNSKILFSEGSQIKYDYLIIACGSETNFFDIPGLESSSYTLKTFTDAIKIRDAVEAAFSESDSKLIRILIGGGGSTGVEFSAELALWAVHLEKKYKRRGGWRIILLEAGPEILSAIEPHVMNIARIRLEGLGVFVRTDAPVSGVKDNEVILGTGEKIPFDIFIWSGGIKANRMLANIELKKDARGRLETENTMECIPANSQLEVAGRIYAIGDTACIEDPEIKKKFVPGVARAAMEQGEVAAYNIVADISKFAKKRYRIRKYPYIIPVGGKWAVAKIGRFVAKGFAGWILKGLVEFRYLDSVLPLSFALKTWLKGLWIFVRND